MNEQTNKKSPAWKRPLLLVLGLIIILLMLRLGVWQLSRAEEKRATLTELVQQSELPALTAAKLFSGPESDSKNKFRKVKLKGVFRNDATIFVDNQVVNGQVGYQVVTPFIISDLAKPILIARGFIGVGKSRDILPSVPKILDTVEIEGRLNAPFAKPPLWDDDYPVFDGSRWQYLPISELSQQLHLDLFPLMVELATINNASNVENSLTMDDVLIRKWPAINDQWVAKHQGYAFQWFAMALAFFIACLILLLKSKKQTQHQ